MGEMGSEARPDAAKGARLNVYSLREAKAESVFTERGGANIRPPEVKALKPAAPKLSWAMLGFTCQNCYGRG